MTEFELNGDREAHASRVRRMKFSLGSRHATRWLFRWLFGRP